MSSLFGNGRERNALLALVAIATALNLTKSFHVDDAYYVAEASWIAEHPTRPMSGEIFWVTDRPEPFYRSNDSPILVPLLQAAVVGVFGPSELPLHALTACFSAIAILLFHALARRFAPQLAILGTAFFALSPAFVAEQNVMLDVPLVASWLGFFLAFGDGGTARSWWRAAAVASLALMIKFSSVALLLFLAAEIVRTRAWRRSVVLALPVATLGTWALFNYVEYGGVQMLSRGLSHGILGVASGETEGAGQSLAAGLGLVVGRAALYVVTLGGVATFLYALVPGLARAGAHRRLVLGAAVALVVLVPIGRWLTTWVPPLATEPFVHTCLRGAFFLLGVIGLVLAIGRARQGDGDDARLLLWLALSALVTVLLSPFVAARHALLVLPPLFLLVARRSDVSLERFSRAGVAIALTIGIATAVADHRIAGVYESRASEIAGHLDAQHRRVLFVGHWGWQHYAERAGLVAYVPGETQLAPGDLLVEPRGVHAQPITDEDRARLELRETIEVPAGPLDLARTLVEREGLYSVWKGLPWSLRTDPLERFDVFEVVQAEAAITSGARRARSR